MGQDCREECRQHVVHHVVVSHDLVHSTRKPWAWDGAGRQALLFVWKLACTKWQQSDLPGTKYACAMPSTSAYLSSRKFQKKKKKKKKQARVPSESYRNVTQPGYIYSTSWPKIFMTWRTFSFTFRNYLVSSTELVLHTIIFATVVITPTEVTDLSTGIINPFSRTPVPLWGQTTQIPSNLSIVPRTRLQF